MTHIARQTVQQAAEAAMATLEAASQRAGASEEERVVARLYVAAVRDTLANERRAGNRVTRRDVERYIAMGFHQFNPTSGALYDLLHSEGMEAVQAVFRRLDIAKRLRDEAVAVLRNARYQANTQAASQPNQGSEEE